jgi:hypothetical protein
MYLHRHFARQPGPQARARYLLSAKVVFWSRPVCQPFRPLGERTPSFPVAKSQCSSLLLERARTVLGSLGLVPLGVGCTPPPSLLGLH